MHDNADPSAYIRDLWSEQERDANSRSERVKGLYIESDRDEDLTRLLNRLARNAASRADPSLPYAANNRKPGMGIVISGDSGAGKTRMLQRMFRNNPLFPNYGTFDAAPSPLISVQAPSPCTLLQLAIRILQKLDYAPQREIRENVAWLRVRDQMRAQGTLFLHIDDIQHVLAGLGETEVQKVRDTLKDLMLLESPIQLILSGIPELLPFTRMDRQLKRRLRYLYLPKIAESQHGDFLAASIDHYAGEAGLRTDLKAEDCIVPRLLHAGLYELGMSLEILCEAVEFSLHRGAGVLTLKDFQSSYADRNLMPNEQNIFASPAWQTIDASLVTPRTSEEAEQELKTSKSRQRKKS